MPQVNGSILKTAHAEGDAAIEKDRESYCEAEVLSLRWDAVFESVRGSSGCTFDSHVQTKVNLAT